MLHLLLNISKSEHVTNETLCLTPVGCGFHSRPGQTKDCENRRSANDSQVFFFFFFMRWTRRWQPGEWGQHRQRCHELSGSQLVRWENNTGASGRVWMFSRRMQEQEVPKNWRDGRRTKWRRNLASFGMWQSLGLQLYEGTPQMSEKIAARRTRPAGRRRRRRELPARESVLREPTRRALESRTSHPGVCRCSPGGRRSRKWTMNWLEDEWRTGKKRSNDGGLVWGPRETVKPPASNNWGFPQSQTVDWTTECVKIIQHNTTQHNT